MGFFIVLTWALVLWVLGKAWRYFLESSDDFKLIRLLEPWYWFVFLNFLLTLITSNFDSQFMVVGLLIQLALSLWFALSMGWVVQSCKHATAVTQHSWFVKGKTVKYCHRCGTRLPSDFHAHFVESNSAINTLLQIPPHLFEYICFWIAQSVMVLISLFILLRFLKNPDYQDKAVLAAIFLVVLAPPAIYFFGRFRRYLSHTKGLIWWEDIKGSTIISIVIWLVVVGLLGCLLRFH
jgi:hypothetical protein